jgi:hypothetical protein
MPINLDEFANADNAFQEQIETEMQRVTANLNRIATLLKSGLAHPQVLKEYRESVDRVREAGWIAQQGLDSAQSQKTTEMLFAHRARAALSLLKQLRLELKCMNQLPITVPFRELLEACSSFHEAAMARGAVAAGKE